MLSLSYCCFPISLRLLIQFTKFKAGLANGGVAKFGGGVAKQRAEGGGRGAEGEERGVKGKAWISRVVYSTSWNPPRRQHGTNRCPASGRMGIRRISFFPNRCHQISVAPIWCHHPGDRHRTWERRFSLQVVAGPGVPFEKKGTRR